jgi:hypothetical protein
MEHENTTPASESKLPYSPPEIVESGRFEDLLLTCGHFPSDVSTCVMMGTVANS